MALPEYHDAKLWLALLYELKTAGGRAKPSDLYLKILKHFPSITSGDLQDVHPTGANKWQNRCQFTRQRLVERGLLDRGTRGEWALTALGQQWLHANWQGANADYSKILRPPLLQQPVHGRLGKQLNGAARSASPKPAGATRKEQPKVTAGAVRLTEPIAVIEPVEQLCRRLEASQRKSNVPQQLESDLAEAFCFLGFDARHVGGAGETDVFVRAALSQDSYSAIVDAKSTQSGRVNDQQIDWHAINDHRERRKATFAAVVAEDFSGGRLRDLAGKYSVTLIKTEALCKALRLHASAPFSLFELRQLFEVPSNSGTQIEALCEIHERHRDFWRLLSQVIDSLESMDADDTDGTALTVDGLHAILRWRLRANVEVHQAMPARRDVVDAVGFLASRAVNVLAEVLGSNGAYQLAMSSATARKRLLALAHALDGHTSS